MRGVGECRRGRSKPARMITFPALAHVCSRPSARCSASTSPAASCAMVRSNAALRMPWFVAEPASAVPRHRGCLIHDPAAQGAGVSIACREDGCRTISQLAPGNRPAVPTVLELIPLERGLVAFAAGGPFLSAIPDGKVSLSTPRCSTSELFVAFEAWCSDVVATGGCGVEPPAAATFDRTAIVNYTARSLIGMRAERG